MAVPITDGAALVRKLKESGTGEAKLAVARLALAAARDRGQRAAAEDVLDALAAAEVNPLTLQKAWAFATAGEYFPDEAGSPGLAIEDLLGDAPAPTTLLLPGVGPEKLAPEKAPAE